MQCANCFEDINEGAQVCRFCGSRTPFRTKAEKERFKANLASIFIGAIVVCITLVALIVAADSLRQNRVRKIAECGGYSFESLEKGIEVDARARNTSVYEETDRWALKACPSMGS